MLKRLDRVRKVTGDYQLNGVIVAKFKTLKGKTRFVVEHSPGFLHIYGEKNLRKIKDKPQPSCNKPACKVHN